MSKVAYKFEGSTLKVELDPNGDGQPVLKLELELSEIPDEIFALMKTKKEEAKA